MSLDLGTLSGVLGVILTIIFFFVGYRQTIGAKKERAAAANREIIETLLRRFTLDSDFGPQYEAVERVVAGAALENRVRRSDVYSMDEIFSLLSLRIVGSDYVPAKRRKSILDKLNSSFKTISADIRQLDRSAEARATTRRTASVEALLGVGSAVFAAAVGLVADLLANGVFETLSAPSMRSALLMAIAGSALTAIGLVLYVRLRDRATTTTPDSTPTTRAEEFEFRIVERLRAVGIPFTEERDVDLIASLKHKRIAIELKASASSLHAVRPILNQLKQIIDKYRCDEAYLVFSTSVPDRIRNLSDDRVKIMSAEELLALLTGPEPLRERIS
jgi:hypothetical protein